MLCLAGGVAHADDWVGPDDLWRPPAAEAPERSAAMALVEELITRVRDGRVTETWLSQAVSPQQLPPAAEREWTRTWRRALDARAPVGIALARSPGAVAAVAGPEYQRVLIGAAPGPSVLVRQGSDGAVIEELEWTTCTLCSERVRFVLDLLDEVQRKGRRAHRLLPGVELAIDEHLDQTGLGEDWVATLQLRNATGGHLATTLPGARVVRQDGDVVHVRYPSGADDTWRIVWDEGRWQVDYAALAEDSPLRLGRHGLSDARSPARLAQGARDAWSPTWAPVGQGGISLGSSAVDAWPDSRDGTVLVVVIDVDRVLSAAFRVDPETRRVLERIPLPGPNPQTPMPLEGWLGAWRTALSPNGRALALTVPNRVYTVDLDTQRSSLISRGDVSWLGWTHGDSAPQLLVGREESLWRHQGRTAIWRHKLPGRPLVGWCTSAEGRVLDVSGAVTDLDTDEVVARVCCGEVVHAAADDGGSDLLASCASPCDVAAVLVDEDNDTTDLAGEGASGRGASFSPDGRWLTTAAPDPDRGLLLWDRTSTRPVATVPTGPVHVVRWDGAGEALITVDATGEVVWWDVARIVAEHGL